MADEQTSDFFNPPADDAAAFAAPPSGDDSQIGDVFYGDAQTGDFETPSAEGDAPIVLGESAPYESPADGDTMGFSAYESPADGDTMGFAAYESPADGDAGMGFAAPGVVEAVSDDEEEEMAAAAGTELVSAEPTAMAKWNEEWQTTLLERKEEENSIKASHVEKAREDIAAFQAEREKRRESRMAKNRSDEQDKLEAIEADLENDNSYQRVVKMIELNQDSGEGAVDTGRMKDVLVLLKNEPARADALGA